MSNSTTQRPNGQPAANGHYSNGTPRSHHSTQEIRDACQCGKSSCECQRPGGKVHCPAHNDGAPSLSITEQNGKTLWKCHSGCSQEAVTKAVKGLLANEISISHRAVQPTAAKKPARFDWSSATKYDYKDEQDTLLFQVARQGDGTAKQIRQRRPDGRGGWVYSLGDSRRTLYRLPEVLAARAVIICEGEKAVEALRAAFEEAGLLGEFAVTTNPHGAGKWRPEYSEVFADKDVYIMPDNDEAGRDHAQQVALSAAPVALETRVVELPDQPEKAGADDFLARGKHIGELLEIAEAAPVWTAKAATTPNAEQPSEEAPAPRPRFVFVGAQHVKAQKPPRALIAGMLFENTGAELCGGQATFKSFTALAITEAVASGADWHGRETRRTPAAYITGEGSAAIGQRIRALEIHTGRSCEVQFLLEAVQLHRPEEVEALLLAIAQLPEKPGLIVVDTLARCFVGGDENSARDAGLFVAGVDRIRAVTGATVLILHHLSKNGDTRGSTAFAGAFDTIIEARRENTVVSLRCLKQKDAPDFEAVTLARRVVELDTDGEDGQPLTSLVFETTDAPEPIETPSKGEATRAKVLELLRELCEEMPKGAPTRRFQIEAEARGITRPTFLRHRDALRGAGEITFDGERYQIKKEVSA